MRGFARVGRYKLLTGQLTHYPPPLLAVSGFPVTQPGWPLLTPDKLSGLLGYRTRITAMIIPDTIPIHTP